MENLENETNQDNETLNQLNAIVEQSMIEQQLLMENLLHPPIEKRTIAEKLSDKLAQFGGSWSFLISFAFIIGGWILINIYLMDSHPFDPYPFILLNLVLSCIAAIQAPIIMMSQNRMEQKDRKRNENDYMINLKSELEIRSLHQKIDLLISQHEKIVKQKSQST